MAHQQNDDLPTNALLPKFKGEGTSDARMWLDRFTRLARIKGWNREQKLAHFPLFLAHNSAASRWYDGLPQDLQTNWANLSDAFTERFQPTEGKRLTLLYEFQNRKLQPGESVDTFMDDIRAKGNLLDKNENDLIDTIVMNLPPNLKSYVVSRDPDTIQDVIRHTRMAESLYGQETPATVNATMLDDLCDKICNKLATRSDLNVLNNATLQNSSSSPSVDELEQFEPPPEGYRPPPRAYRPPASYQPPQRYQGRQQSYRPPPQPRRLPPTQSRPSAAPPSQGHRLPPYSGPYRAGQSFTSQNITCFRCGGNHYATSCRHIGSQCRFCKIFGHLQRVCRRARAALATQG